MTIDLQQVSISIGGNPTTSNNPGEELFLDVAVSNVSLLFLLQQMYKYSY